MIKNTAFKVGILTLFCFILMATSVLAVKQSVIYIGTNGKLTSLKNALYMQRLETKSSRNSKVFTYQLKDAKWDKIYTEHYKKVNDSTWQIKGNGENIPAQNVRTFTKQANNTWKFRDMVDDKLVRSGYAQSIMPLLLHGKVTEYYPGGKKKSISVYNNNELVSNENWNEDGTKYIDNVFYSVDNFPSFSPGNKKLHEHVTNCFKEAKVDLSNISGSIVVGFVVMEDGTIDGIKLMRGLGVQLNDIAYNAISTLKGQWVPAKLNNKTVRYLQLFPINFIFQENYIEFAEMRGSLLHFQTLER